ncbi:MAG: hypothetical protein ABJF04_24505 [Reichenbachiella sp.]|uniref:hypothetical protein n=1 Tax=Reichenbachiella sp. TaxID=2184521 RepID=UPI003263CFA1
MHKPIIIPFLLTVFVSLSLTTGCGPEATLDTSSKEAFINNISQTWTVDEDSYVLIEDQDITHLLTGFEIAIDGDLNFVTNSDQLTLEEFPWPTSGSFDLNDEFTELTRDDGLVVTLVIGDDGESLEFDFEADENTTSRTLGIRGGWKVGLNKKP